MKNVLITFLTLTISINLFGQKHTDLGHCVVKVESESGKVVYTVDAECMKRSNPNSSYRLALKLHKQREAIIEMDKLESERNRKLTTSEKVNILDKKSQEYLDIENQLNEDNDRRARRNTEEFNRRRDLDNKNKPKPTIINPNKNNQKPKSCGHSAEYHEKNGTCASPI